MVCGHIHTAEVRQIGEVTYYNDGDWVESCTALVEHPNGRMEILDWAEQKRLEAEARIREQFDAIETLFARAEARVSREGNSLVLRLVGLTFPSGSAEIDAAYRPLLQKVARAADVFPRSQIVIEGHTDSYGSDEANLTLSQRRAEAVSQHLTGEHGLAAFRMSAVGYGETRPIANNETAQGRERNRRIDVRIEPQLQ